MTPSADDFPASRKPVVPALSRSTDPNNPKSIPVSRDRIVIIDAIRGIAILGILMVNINWFGMPFQYNMDLNLHNEYSGPNYYIWIFSNSIFEGSFRALFSLLFGASTLLLLHRAEKKADGLAPADFYYRRLIWLLVFGLVNAFVFLWPADILYPYALCGFFLYPFRNLKARHLLYFGLAVILVSGIKSTNRMYNLKSLREKGETALMLESRGVGLTEEQQEDRKNWLQYEDMNNTAALRKQADAQNTVLHKKYFDISRYYKTMSENFESVNLYLYDFWDVLSFFFIGMALFKWGILTAERSKKFYWTIFVVGYSVGLCLGLLILRAHIRTHFDDTRTAGLLYVDFYQEKRLFMSMGHLGLIMLLYKYHVIDGIIRTLARVGQMTLTNYLMQSILCGLFFYGFGFGEFGKLQRYQLYYVVLGVWAFQILFSNIWMSYFRFGPFEWLWRSLTYWKLQPLRKEKEVQPIPLPIGATALNKAQ